MAKLASLKKTRDYIGGESLVSCGDVTNWAFWQLCGNSIDKLTIFRTQASHRHSRAGASPGHASLFSAGHVRSEGERS